MNGNENGRYIHPDSNGRFYSLHSMVKTDCHDCEGCSKCCEGMGDSIFLEPYDMFILKNGVGLELDELLKRQYVKLGVRDGIVEPHIQMRPDTDSCPFLNGEGLCNIHQYRPGICRLFPLGRNYEDGRLTYIFLNRACGQKNRTKIRVDKWLGVKRAEEYERFVLSWHSLRKALSGFLAEADEEQAGELNLYLLRTFFTTQTEKDEQFYQEFYEKLGLIKKAFGL